MVHQNSVWRMTINGEYRETNFRFTRLLFINIQSITNVIESLANIVREIKVEKRLIKCDRFKILKKFLIKLRLAKLNLYIQKQK